jgi:Flp pilus assembly pilin Flp
MTLSISYPNIFTSFWNDQSGGTAVEYAFVAGLIFLGVATSVHFYADRLSSYYKGFTSEIQKVMTP